MNRNELEECVAVTVGHSGARVRHHEVVWALPGVSKWTRRIGSDMEENVASLTHGRRMGFSVTCAKRCAFLVGGFLY